MFKKSFSVLFLVYIILLCSCSNTQVSLSPIIINETLRNQIAVNQETIEWTKEIDGHILYEGKKEKIDKEDSTLHNANSELEALIRQGVQMKEEAEKQKNQPIEEEKKISLKPSKRIDNLYMYVTDSAVSIYPSLSDFGSLDTRAIDNSIKNILDAFLVSMKNKNIDKKLFSPSRAYTAGVLEYLLIDYPDPEKWVYGKPYYLYSEASETIEVPVRVWSKASYYDMLIYVSSTGTADYIDQIQLGSLVVD